MIDTASRELWESAKSLFMMTLKTQEDKSQAERYFSMITSVKADGLKFVITTSNSYSAELLKSNYFDQLKKSFDLAGADKNMSIEFQVDAVTRPSIVETYTPPSATSSSPLPSQQQVRH